MPVRPITPLTSATLRRELSARNLERAGAALPYETTFGPVPSVIYAAIGGAGHGNFLPAAYRRICADPLWRARLDKAYTGGRRVMRAHDRRRGELECATSSDALLMNLFCSPGLLLRPGVCRVLGADRGLRPEFGVRLRVPLVNGRCDRTEADLLLGDLIVEAKLTESGFGGARESLLHRYRDLAEVFTIEELPRASGGAFLGYQLIRSVLAAHASERRFLLLSDGRRADLHQTWFRVLRAVRCYGLRSRLAVATWQELAAEMPRSVRRFLVEKYGIEKTG